MDWAAASEWANAFIATVALFLAWKAGTRAKQLYEDGKNNEKMQEQLRRRSEPAKLSVWFAAQKQGTYAWGLVLNNVAERPFYHLLIEGEYPVNAAAGKSVRQAAFYYQFVKVIPPGRFFVPYKHEEPEGQYLFDHPQDYNGNLLTPLLTSKKHIIRCIRFTDSDGFEWESDGLGNLQEKSNPADSIRASQQPPALCN